MARSIAAEYQDVGVQVVDLSSREWRSSEAAGLTRAVASIASAQSDAIETAWRDGALHVRSSDILELAPATPEQLPLRNGGVYIVVGGATGIGLTVCDWLTRNYGARLLIIGRSPLDETRSAAIRMLRRR